MGITIAKSEVVSTLKVGEHSSTFGGGPLVCAACKASFDLMTHERLWERAAIQGERFRQGLERLQSNSSIIRDVRGLGLMLGVEFKFDVLNIITECMNDGVLVLDAGRNVVRFLPAVVITSDEIDRTVNVFGTVVEREERARLRSPAIE
jgi:acetylornithine/LysW-gamma-L-lysine aminotransferase